MRATCLTFTLLAASSAQAVVLFEEDFESVTLGPIVTFGDSDNGGEFPSREAWTDIGPTGWVTDASGVPGDPVNDGVREFRGWTFVDDDWWTLTAGDQARSTWSGGYGKVAVADPDEFDDFSLGSGEGAGPSPDGCTPGDDCYDTTLTTPAISLAGVGENEARIIFDSSWRPEDSQKASLEVSYDGGAFTPLFTYSSVDGDGVLNGNFTEVTDANGVRIGEIRGNGELIDEVVDVPLNNPNGAGSVQVRFNMFDAGNDWWWAVDNLQVYTGTPGPRDPALRVTIDRDSGAVSVFNGTGDPVDLRGYEIASADGAFDSVGAVFQSDSDSDWVQLSEEGSGTDLSEGHISSETIAPNGFFSLGSAWDSYYLDEGDVEFRYLVAGSDRAVRGLVEFTGNGGASFDFLDLNYDGSIDILDWETFKMGYGKSLTGLTTAQRYNLGDIDGDGRHTARDFIEFENRFDAVNGVGAFSAMVSAVPEPGTLGLVAASLIGAVALRRRAAALAILLVACCMPAGAQVVLFSEDFEGLPLDVPVEEAALAGDTDAPVVTRTAPTGWSIDNSTIPVGPGDDQVLGTPDDEDGIVDWLGWSFADRAWWIEAAGDQDRSDFQANLDTGFDEPQFGVNTIAVADPDEWDDAANINEADGPGALYETFLKTPVINIPAGSPEGVIRLSMDSSWRPEDAQKAALRVSYDGGAFEDVFVYESFNSTTTQVLGPDGQQVGGIRADLELVNEQISLLDLGYDGSASTLQLEFAMFDAGNDWWWAVDNIEVVRLSNPLRLRVNTYTGEAFLLGDDTSPTEIDFFAVDSESGALAGTATTGLSGAGLGAEDGPDGGGTAGDSPGEQWEILTDPETAANQFAEAFLFGDTALTDTSVIELGVLLNPSTAPEDRDLRYSYTLENGALVEIAAENVEYFFDDSATLPGDFNGNGSVGPEDYTVWRDGLGTTFTQSDYDTWARHYGLSVGAAPSGTNAIPEPNAAGLIGLLAAGILGLRGVRS